MELVVQAAVALFNRANVLLKQTRHMTGPDAYRWLRRKAMDQGRRIADVSAELVAAEARDAP